MVLRREISKLEDELEVVEAGLVAFAQVGDQVDLVDEEREGKQFLAEGSAVVVPVVFTADKIVGSFTEGSTFHRSVAGIAQQYLGWFYEPEKTWKMKPKNGKSFRSLAESTLGKVQGPEFVTACLARDKHGIPKSDIKIEWKRAKGKDGI